MLARTRRVQIAKKLLDETAMTITEIACVAGFTSIRRFNTAFKDTYGRPPSHLKRASRSGNLNVRTVTMELAYRPQFNWSLLAALLATEATPGVEAVSDSEYRRTIALDQAIGCFSIRPVPGQHGLCLSLQLSDYTWLKHIMERLRTMFDLSANPEEIGRHLERPPQLAPGLRLPGAWDEFEVAVRVLVARDIGHHGAAAVMGKLAATCGPPLVAADSGWQLLGGHYVWLSQGRPNAVACSATCANSLRRPTAHETFLQHSMVEREKRLAHCSYVHYDLNL